MNVLAQPAKPTLLKTTSPPAQPRSPRQIDALAPTLNADLNSQPLRSAVALKPLNS